MRFENSWYPGFSRLRNLHDDKTLVEVKKKVADGNDLGIYFMDSGDTASPREFEVLEELCWISLDDVELGIGIAGHRKAV
jgi:hypothetical protein